MCHLEISSCLFFRRENVFTATPPNRILLDKLIPPIAVARKTPIKKEMLLYTGQRLARGTTAVSEHTRYATPGETRPPRGFSIKTYAHRNRAQGVTTQVVVPRQEKAWPSSASIRRGCCDWSMELTLVCVCVSFCIGVCVTFVFYILFSRTKR